MITLQIAHQDISRENKCKNNTLGCGQKNPIV